MQREYINISLASNIKATARRLADERGQTLSGLISALIFEKGEESSPTGITPSEIRPIGRPRHTAEDKQITQLIEQAERLSAHWKNQLESGKFVAMFGDLLGKLDWAREARDVPTLKTLAEGNVWEEAVDAYYEREKEEDRNVNS